MKKRLLSICVSFIFVLCTPQANAQIIEVVRQASKKVIRAIDLAVQRQQNKVIWLQNAQKQIENTFSKLKLDQISDWTEKARKLYEDYFQELWEVKNIISTCKSIKEIIDKQLQLVSEFRNAWRLLNTDQNFSPNELDRMLQTYTGILDESVKNLDQLLLVVNSFKTQMSDGKRLEFISRSKISIEMNLFDLRQLNYRNYQISKFRSQAKKEGNTLRNMYGY